MSNVPECLAHMVVSDARSSKRCLRRCAKGELVRVFRHAFVEAKWLDVPNQWEYRRRVTLARACAVVLVLGPGVVVSHVTAAVLHRIPMMDTVVDVHVCVGQRWGGRRGRLPAVRTPGRAPVPAVDLIRHSSEIPAPRKLHHAGITVTDLPCTAVQCAAHLAPREGFVIVSGILARLSAFDRFHRHRSRESEETWRNEILARLRDCCDRRGARRARAVISAADAGCESVQEAVLVWILKAAGFRGVRTQVAFRVGEQVYFVDVHIEGTDTVLEFDGKLKYGRDAREVLEALSRQNQRQKDLEYLGLVVLRFEAHELSNWRAVGAEVGAPGR